MKRPAGAVPAGEFDPERKDPAMRKSKRKRAGRRYTTKRPGRKSRRFRKREQREQRLELNDWSKPSA